MELKNVIKFWACKYFYPWLLMETDKPYMDFKLKFFFTLEASNECACHTHYVYLFYRVEVADLYDTTVVSWTALLDGA